MVCFEQIDDPKSLLLPYQFWLSCSSSFSILLLMMTSSPFLPPHDFIPGITSDRIFHASGKRKKRIILIPVF